jgi:NAD(P)-dependent dehydrogenase (short-subunit alcohol dehydrogenase family)
LARRLHGTNVTSNALDPGGVATNLGRNNGFFSWMRHIVYHALKRDLISAGKGAGYLVSLASSPAVEGVSGKYYYRDRETRSSPISYDEGAVRRLWDLSINLTSLNDRIGPAWALIRP